MEWGGLRKVYGKMGGGHHKMTHKRELLEAHRESRYRDNKNDKRQ